MVSAPVSRWSDLLAAVRRHFGRNPIRLRGYGLPSPRGAEGYRGSPRDPLPMLRPFPWLVWFVANVAVYWAVRNSVTQRDCQIDRRERMFDDIEANNVGYILWISALNIPTSCAHGKLWIRFA